MSRLGPGKSWYYLFALLGVPALIGVGLSHYPYDTSTYRYRNFSGRLDPVLAPKPLADFRVAIIGDSRGNMEAAEHVITDARSKSDFGFILGDLVRYGSDSQFHYLIQELNELEKAFGRPYPIYTLVGNHDLSGHNSDAYRKFFGPEHYYFFAGDTLFVAINNCITGSYQAELGWMDRVLNENSSKAKQVFVLMHIPPFVVTKNMGHHPPMTRQQTDQLMKVLHKYPIRAIFASHIHDNLQYQSEGIKVYVNGEGGAEQSHRTPQYGYLLLTVAGTDYQVEHVALGNIHNDDAIEQLLVVKCRPVWPWLAGICLAGILLNGFFGWKKNQAGQAA